MRKVFGGEKKERKIIAKIVDKTRPDESNRRRVKGIFNTGKTVQVIEGPLSFVSSNINLLVTPHSRFYSGASATHGDGSPPGGIFV